MVLISLSSVARNCISRASFGGSALNRSGLGAIRGTTAKGTLRGYANHTGPDWQTEVAKSRPERRKSSNSELTNAVRDLKEKGDGQPDILSQYIKKFVPYTTYDPFDFSMTKKRLERLYKKHTPAKDPFAASGINPLKLWKDPAELSWFLSSSGRILPGRLTGCKGKNQRRLAKAIKRARAAGLLSTVHQDVSFLPEVDREK